MQISKTQNNPIFGSGLTPRIIEMERAINPESAELFFQNFAKQNSADFGRACFKDNKAYALANMLCAGIFSEFKSMHDYTGPFKDSNCLLPRNLYVFDKEDTVSEFYNAHPVFTTTSCTQSNILKDKTEFGPQSIFMNNRFNNLKEINDLMNERKREKFLSSSHFLGFFIHEWFHALQLKMIQYLADVQNYGNYVKTIGYSLSRNLNDAENAAVTYILGEYASTRSRKTPQFAEVFAEGWTKLFCESLDEDCLHFKKDPLEELKKAPPAFQVIMKKVTDIIFIGNENSNSEGKIVEQNIFSA